MITALLAALLAQDLTTDIDRANDADKPQYQVQAIKKLRDRGADAAPAVLQWVEKKGRKAMGILFTQFLGELRDERVGSLLAELVGDRDFFWRPFAAAALAEHADARHRDLFRTLLKDALWGVRAGAIVGLERLKDKESLPAIRALLNDPIYDVRAQAARTMHGFGDETGLPVLVESLKSAVTWFEIDYGQIAREDAWNFLVRLTWKPDAHEARLLGEFRDKEGRSPTEPELEALRKAAREAAREEASLGFKPWEPPAQRAAGLARWEEWIAKKFPDWRERVPENARCTTDNAEYVFGFELRSCQRGDFFFRIDAAGNFVLGYFNLERTALTKEERARFDKALEAVLKVDRELPYGRGGCDFEQYYLKVDGRFQKLWVGLGGRPPEMDGFIRVCREIVKAKFGDAEASDFKERTQIFKGVD